MMSFAQMPGRQYPGRNERRVARAERTRMTCSSVIDLHPPGTPFPAWRVSGLKHSTTARGHVRLRLIVLEKPRFEYDDGQVK